MLKKSTDTARRTVASITDKIKRKGKDKMENKEFNYKKRNFYTSTDRAEAAYEYAKGYTAFLDSAKTEREAVKEAVKRAEACGYKPYTFGMKVKAGDKLYDNNRGKFEMEKQNSFSKYEGKFR